MAMALPAGVQLRIDLRRIFSQMPGRNCVFQNDRQLVRGGGADHALRSSLVSMVRLVAEAVIRRLFCAASLTRSALP